MQGWIKLHREIYEKPIWLESTPEQKTILITLLGMANHQEKQWEWSGSTYKLKPGQFITSLESIANKCGKGVSVQNVRTALKRFESYQFLTNKSTNKNRLITIVNWGFYQDSESELTNKLTSNQQATNKQLTTNNNVKNEKNEKKKQYSLQINHLRQRYSENQLKAIDDYFEMLKHTRTSANINDSVILKIYQSWDKHPPICVEYGVKVHTENPAYHSKKENYTLGIIRNTSADEAARKVKGANKQVMPDSRDKDVEFQQWCLEGKNPELFDWSK